MQFHVRRLDSAGRQRLQRGKILCQPYRGHEPGKFRRRADTGHADGEIRGRVGILGAADNADLERQCQLADEAAILAD